MRHAITQAASQNSENIVLNLRDTLQFQEEQARVRRLELQNRELELQIEQKELELLEMRNRIRDQSQG